jgi:hypothetical protein
LVPQFHGREHFNFYALKEKLIKRDERLLHSLRNRSFANFGYTSRDTISWTASYSFYDPEKDTDHFFENITSGLDDFKLVYGYPASIFTPPAQQFPSFIEQQLKGMGLKGIDKQFHKKRHIGYGKYKREFSSTGVSKSTGLINLVRNVVFEPSLGEVDHVSHALRQIQDAFFWNSPVIISSHRVNFCGHIDELNRKNGLSSLHELISKILMKWPDVEFLSAPELADLINVDS